MNNTTEVGSSRDQTELECLIDDVAAGGADGGVGGAPGHPAPHPAGQAGQAGGRAGGRTERGLEAGGAEADTETGELVGLVSGSSVDHFRRQGRHREVVHRLRGQQFNLQSDPR